jgi:hypothetical protein
MPLMVDEKPKIEGPGAAIFSGPRLFEDQYSVAGRLRAQRGTHAPGEGMPLLLNLSGPPSAQAG